MHLMMFPPDTVILCISEPGDGCQEAGTRWEMQLAYVGHS